MTARTYTVTSSEPCLDCQGTGRSTNPEHAPEGWDGSAYACIDCDGTGHREIKLSLADAMRQVDEDQNKQLYEGLPWHRYADVDTDAAAGSPVWAAHNAQASNIAHTLTGFEQWRSADEMARGLAFIPSMTFHGVQVIEIADGTLALDVDGQRIELYNRDDRAGENIWSSHYLARAWSGVPGEFGMLRLTSFGWAFISYPELHALRRAVRTQSSRAFEK